MPAPPKRLREGRTREQRYYPITFFPTYFCNTSGTITFKPSRFEGGGMRYLRFRRWLATKGTAYEARISGSESSDEIGRAIRLFQTETKGSPKAAATPRDTARAERIRGAVQPRGDNAGAPPGKSDDDEFLAGFNSR